MRPVSVVVPVLDAARTVPNCLRALDGLDPAPQQTLLVDNGSRDGSLALLREFGLGRSDVEVLEEPERGAAAARNRGIRAARGEIVAFTDADCAPEPGWLRHLIPPLERQSVGAVAGRVIPAPPRSTLELFNALYTLRLPADDGRFQRWTPRSGGFPTANLAVRRSLLDAVGEFDEEVGIYGEDYDLCARLYRRGAEIRYEPAARVVHHHRVRLGPMLRQAFGFGRSHAYLLRRHGRGLWLDLPGLDLAWESSPFTGWIDLAGADKKLLIMAGVALAWPFLWPLPALYGAWLPLGCARRARAAGAEAWGRRAAPLAGLLLLKSAALSSGRLWGSLRYGALCV